MARYVSIFTKEEFLQRGNIAISAEKMSRLVSGDAEILIHRAHHQDGPIIYIYSGEELRKLLGRAVRNGHTAYNQENGREEVSFFLARFTDPSGKYGQKEEEKEECDCEDRDCENCSKTNIPF